MTARPPRLRYPRVPARSAIFILALLILLPGCLILSAPPRRSDQLPPISTQATNTWQPGRFVWLELITPDAAAARKFYGTLLGWTFKQLPEQPEYTEIFNRQRRIGGIIELKPENRQKVAAQWLGTLSVANLDTALALVKERGGKILNGPVAMSQRGAGALVSDPQGANLVLLRAKEGDPPEHQPGIGDWLWVEDWTTELAPAVQFYKELGGYQKALTENGYAILINQDKWRAGIRQIQDAAFSRRWVPAVRVENAAPLAERATALGGRIWIKPGQSPANPDTALISDDAGALLILQPWEFSGEEKP